jgi:hypothetical protein
MTPPQMAADPEFDAEQSDADRFEAIWRQAVTRGCRTSMKGGPRSQPKGDALKHR